MPAQDSAPQDDARERELRTLFNLTRPQESGRADVDAVLTLEGRAIPRALAGTLVSFELKSATDGRPTFSTARDFGPHYLDKWRPLHWLFGVYEGGRLEYCMYGSPQRMKPWFDRMAGYVAPDFALAAQVPALIKDATLTAIIGPESEFTADDGRRLMKSQYSAADYLSASDRPEAWLFARSDAAAAAPAL